MSPTSNIGFLYLFSVTQLPYPPTRFQACGFASLGFPKFALSNSMYLLKTDAFKYT